MWENFVLKIFRKKFVQDVGVLTLSNFAVGGLGLVQGILVARLLGPELYGVAALVMAYPSFIYTILDFRSRDAGVKYLTSFSAEGQSERAIGICKLCFMLDILAAGIALLVVAGTSAWAERKFVGTTEMASLMVLFSFALLPKALLSTSNAILIAMGRFSVLAVITLMSAILRMGLVLVLIWKGYQVFGVVLGNAIGLAINGMAQFFMASRIAKQVWGKSWIHAKRDALKGYGKEIRRFLIYNNLDRLLSAIMKQLDVLLLGFYKGPQEVGYYRLAKNLVAIPENISRPLGSVAYQRLGRLWGEQKWKEMWSFVRRTTLKLGLPLCGLVVFCILLAGPIIGIAGGDKYFGSVPIIKVLLVIPAFQFTLFCIPPLLLTWGQVEVRLINKLVAVLLSLLGFIVLIPEYGGLGVAFSLAAASIAGGGLAIVWIMLWGKDKAKNTLQNLSISRKYSTP